MALETLETSDELGKPVELYFFRYGSDPAAYYAYCDGPEAVTREVVPIGPVVFQPLPINRGRTPLSGSLDKTRLTVGVPMDSAIAELFRLYPPSYVVILTIRETHYGDPDAETGVTWVGRVLNCARAKGGDIHGELTCEPSSTSMRRNGLRRLYSIPCTHDLYGDRCRADKVRATMTHNITAFGANSVTLPAGWNGAFAASRFVGGIIEWLGVSGPVYRTIMRVSGNVLYLTGPTTGLSNGYQVKASLGCRHNLDDCENLHLNILNYGGQPWIPLENPIASNPFLDTV